MKVLLYQFHLQKKDLTFSLTKPHQILLGYGEYWKLSSESCKKYAEKWGWDYIFVNPSEEEWEPFCVDQVQFEELRAIKYLKHYDVVVYVDSDILIKPDAPNVVDEYKDDGTNIVVNTTIGNRILEGSSPSTIGVNTGVVLWFNNSKFIKNLYGLDGGNSFLFGSFVESRSGLKWWERLDELKPFMGKMRTGFYNNEKFLTFLISVYNIPISHLHSKYNYRISPHNNFDVMSDDNWFIHYTENTKSYMEQHYNIIME